jgi:hypothetical protein
VFFRRLFGSSGGREGGEKQGNKAFLFRYFLRVQGKKKGYSVVQNDSVLGFFLTVYETVLFWPKRVVSIK